MSKTCQFYQTRMKSLSVCIDCATIDSKIFGLLGPLQTSYKCLKFLVKPKNPGKARQFLAIATNTFSNQTIPTCSKKCFMLIYFGHIVKRMYLCVSLKNPSLTGTHLDDNYSNQRANYHEVLSSCQELPPNGSMALEKCNDRPEINEKLFKLRS